MNYDEVPNGFPFVCLTALPFRRNH